MGTETNQRGPGYWKLNVSYLEDSEYIIKITEIIKNTLLEYDAVEDKRIIWDLMKVLIKEYSIKQSQIKASERKQKTLKIEKQIEILDKSLLKNNSSTFVIKKRAKKKLSNILLEKAVGAQIRSRAKYIEEGEKSTQYFLSLEKRRQTNNTIKKIINSENVYSTNKEIMKYSTSFYKELYKTYNPNQNT